MSLHRQAFFAGRNLCFGCTSPHDVLHGSTPSMPLRKGFFFAEKESGFGRVFPVWVRSCSADFRRCFCTSEARIVDGNVGSFDLQADDDISKWEEQIKPHVRKYVISRREVPLYYQGFATAPKAVHASEVGYDDSVLHHDGAVVDGINDSLFPRQNNMGGFVTRNISTRRRGTRTDRKWEATAFTDDMDAQDPSVFQYNDAMGECLSSERLEDSDDEVDEENLLSRLTVQSEDHHVFTLDDRKTVKAVCELLNSKGWSASTKETLEKECCSSLSHAVMSAVILRQRNVILAASFFEWACEQKGHNFRIYRAYLVRLGETKHFEEMWALLSKMKENGLEVSGTIFCMIIRACGVVAGVPAMAVNAFEKAHEYGVVSDNQLHQALLTMFFESNLPEEAKIFYSIMVQQGLAFDTHMFNALIKGFNRFSAMEDAQISFETMLKEGHEPNILSYNGLIEAYCTVCAIENAMSAFSDLQRRGLKPTASTVNLLLGTFCKMGRISDAVDLFGSMSTVCTPNRSTFNILLRGLLVCKETSKAISLFSLMEQAGIVNQVTFTYLASGLRTSKQTDSVRQLLKTLFAKHGYGMRCVSIALLDNLCRSGEIDEAESLFNGMLESSQEPYVPSFAIMISLYSRLGMPDRAFNLLSELKGKGLRPTVFCYLPLIAALLKASRVTDALKCFQEMLEQKHDLNASICDNLLRQLCKHGMVDDALHVLSNILTNKFSIKIQTLTELMKCLCKFGKVEEASSCFRALHKQHCLPLPKAAAVQALNVMYVMSCSSNEDRVSTCVAL